MDNLKKYLEQQREALDKDIPGDAVWMKIKEGSFVKKKTGTIRMIIQYAVAASVLALIILSVKWMMKQPASPKNTEVVIQHPVVPSTDTTVLKIIPLQKQEDEVAVVKENKKEQADKNRYAIMNSLEAAYTEVVKLQESSIRNTAIVAEDPVYFKGFKTELQEADAEEVRIRKTISEKGIDDVLLEQLIDVYQRKLNVLKILRTEINKMNERASYDSSTNYHMDI
ncbi:MAG: hypothetical protein ABJA78_01915 [Ferruginibacter sp.]